MDVTAFAAFYTRHYRLVLTVAQQRLGGWSDAEDITAEAFRIAWAHHQEGHQLSLPWLYQVVRNLIGNEFRRLARADGFVHTVGLLIEEQTAELSDENAREVRRCIRLLPEDSRELLYMAYWEGLSRDEIAAILGCTATAVRLRLMRVRRRLQGMLMDDSRTIARREVSPSDGRYRTTDPCGPAYQWPPQSAAE